MTRKHAAAQRIRGKFYVAACFLTYLPKSIFQHFGKLKIRGRVKFHADPYSLRNAKAPFPKNLTNKMEIRSENMWSRVLHPILYLVFTLRESIEVS